MEMSGLASARQSLLLLISDARQSDIEHVQINRVFGTLIAPYQGILFLLACAVLWNHVPNHWLVIFLLLFAIEACVKIVLTRRYKSLTADEQKSGYWRRVLWIGMAYSGLSYGVAALVMMQPMPTDSLVVVIGVFASSVCLNTIFGRSYLPICFTTIVPIFIPTLVLLLASGNWKFQLLAIMLAGLCVLLLHVFRLSSVSSTKLMSAKEENQQLLETVTGEKLQAEKQRALAEQAVVEKNLFIAAASHDLRQPLHAFGLFLSSIREEKQSDKSRQLIHQMEKSTLSLNHLFDNLLDLSRLDAGVVVATPLDQPLSDIFEILRSEFGELAAAKNIKLIVSGDELYVHTDKVLLERMLRNLISNAIERYSSRAARTCFQ